MDFNNLDFVRWGAPATAPLAEGGVPPLPTGIKDFDERIGGGMHPGSLYLQLCSCRECACLGRRAETSALLHGLRKLSEELHLPVLVLEQANRTAIPDSGHINPTMRKESI